jgi:peptidoglycan/xylan/chitin deacetylase (PgdA/CDA1 family)
VVVLDGGRDVYEPSIVETFANAGGNPQYKLGNGVVTVRRGLISKSTVPVAAEGKGPPQVALTFDDGPNPDATPQILDVLRRENVKATFFVVGTMAAAYPKLITREVAEGMSIGDHTWTHPHLAGRDATFVRNQLVETRNTLKPLGADVTVFRPPYGSYTATTVQIAQSLGMRTVIWTIDPADYRKPAPTVIVRRVMNQLKPGAIILMHDGGGDRSRTVAALKMLIQQIRKRGYGFSALR